jgi:hypothetical protein
MATLILMPNLDIHFFEGKTITQTFGETGVRTAVTFSNALYKRYALYSLFSAFLYPSHKTRASENYTSGDVKYDYMPYKYYTKRIHTT